MPRFGRVPGLLDESSQIVYDTLALVAGQATYRYFLTPIGGVKTRLDTSMVSSGQLPAPQSMIVQAVRVILKEATSAQADAFLNRTRVEFKVGEKEALVAPTVLFSGGAGMVNRITTDRGVNGLADPRAIWALAKPIVIGVQQNFYLDIIYDTAPATALAGWKVLVVLDGFITRGVQ